MRFDFVRCDGRLVRIAAAPRSAHAGDIVVRRSLQDNLRADGHVAVHGQHGVLLEVGLRPGEVHALLLEDVVSPLVRIAVREEQQVRQGAQQAILVVRRDEDAAVEEVHGLVQHVQQNFLVVVDALQVVPQVEEDELPRVARVRQEHLQLVLLLENFVAVGHLLANRPESALVPREVVLQAGFHILQVVDLLKHVQELNERSVEPLRYELGAARRGQLRHVAAEDLGGGGG